MKKYLMIGAAACLLGGAMLTSCSSDKDLYDGTKEAERNAEKLLEEYAANFQKVFGEISPDQTWGFGAPAGTRVTRSNPGETYPSTHQYYDANGNLIASANMNHNEWADPDKEFGGWVVPDPLTEGQKLRVQKYFQANPNLSYEDPHFRHFYVQQVYTGGTSAPETGNKEATVSADGQSHQGMTLNQLTVGAASSHINNFNAGTCTESNVLDNGKTVNNATYHKDQITLMLNVDDTSCFGYHETSGSNTGETNNHNDKMALVSAATIDAWAAANGNPGEAVVDKWNRSFMGFDYEMLPESEIALDSYALLSQVPNINNMQYAWDGTKVMTLGTAPEATQAEEVDITSTFAQNTTGNSVNCQYINGNIVCEFTGQYYNSISFNQYADWTPYDKLVIEFAEPSPITATLTCNGDAPIAVGDTKVEVTTVDYAYNGQGPTISNGGVGTESKTLTIKKVTLVKAATTPDASIVYYNPTYLLGDAEADKVAFYSTNTNMYGGTVRQVSENEMKTSEGYLNLKFFKDLVSDGYHPITTDLKTWVKWQAACDGYYSDWIVTLTEAQRQEPTPTPPTKPFLRVIAEDLTVGEKGDFDFNDIVFDVEYVSATQAKVTILAAGGTLPLTINGQEVHQLFIDANPNASTDQGGEINVMTMINTNAQRIARAPYSSAELENKPVLNLSGNWSDDQDTFSEQVRDNIPLVVTKTKEDGTTYPLTLTAEKGKTPGKVGIASPYYEWKQERVYIGDNFKKFVSDPTYAMWWKE